MKNYLKQALGLGLAFFVSIGTISLCMPDAALTVSAHSGRTDAQGGHHDYKNKSGLGSYHYHHGYPAHLHENGVCPYDSAQPSSSETVPATPNIPAPAAANLPAGSANAGITALPSPNTDAASLPLPVDYSLVFDPAFYAAANPDVAAIYGTDPALLFQHFLISGMQEGRQGNEAFNVWTYRTEHPELATIFGDDLPQYYIYYCINHG